MRVLLDENVPRKLKHRLAPEHDAPGAGAVVAPAVEASGGDLDGLGEREGALAVRQVSGRT
jgi:hypothetical protein